MKYKCLERWAVKWNQIVEEIIREGTSETENGKWNVNMDDLADSHDADSTFNSEIIEAMLSEREEVSAIEVIGDEYAIDFDKRYCLYFQNIEDEIDDLKAGFADQMLMSNAKVDEMLGEIGELIEKWNAATGESQDIKFLYSDDGEWFRFVAGFIGEDTFTTDANGIPLKIGDTVRYGTSERMVIFNSGMEPMLSQEFLFEKGAVKSADFSESDILSAQSVAATVTVKSCREQYQQNQELYIAGLRMS